MIACCLPFHCYRLRTNSKTIGYNYEGTIDLTLSMPNNFRLYGNSTLPSIEPSNMTVLKTNSIHHKEYTTFVSGTNHYLRIHLCGIREALNELFCLSVACELFCSFFLFLMLFICVSSPYC